MSFDRHNRTPIQAEDQCGHLTTICKCDHGVHAHRAGGCDRCGCHTFESRPCRLRKGKCGALTKMARRQALERKWRVTEPLSPEALAEGHAEADSERKIDPTQCGVYFIQCEGFVKIGKTVNLRKRLLAHQLSTPFELTVVGFVRCASGLLDETEGGLHRRFRALHHRGEWFRIEEPIRLFLEKIRPENAKSPSESSSL